LMKRPEPIGASSDVLTHRLLIATPSTRLSLPRFYCTVLYLNTKKMST
jgi:hypothetical protein